MRIVLGNPQGLSHSLRRPVEAKYLTEALLIDSRSDSKCFKGSYSELGIESLCR
jgi:hypothetical protein